MAIFGFGHDHDPFAGLLALQRELERAFQRPLGSDLGLSGPGVFPQLNLFEDQDGYRLRAEVPGVRPEDLDVQVHGRTLTIEGRHRPEEETGERSYHRRERRQGAFSRSVQLPPDADPTRVEAVCRHGMLTVSLPRREEAKPRQVSVRTR